MAGSPRRPRLDTGPFPAGRRLPGLTGHRAASWLLASITLIVLLSAALAWVVLTSSSSPGVPVVTAVLTVATLMAGGHFRVGMLAETTSRVVPVVAAVATSGFVTTAGAVVLFASEPSIDAVIAVLGCLVVASLFARALGAKLIQRLWSSGRLRAAALVYGTDSIARELAVEVELRRSYGIDIAGFIGNSCPPHVQLPGPLFGTDTDLAEMVRRTGADRIIIGPGAAPADRSAMQIARRAVVLGMPVFVVPRFFEMGLGTDAFAPDRARGYPLIRLQRAAHPQISIRMKRLLDIAVSFTVLVLTAPLALVIAALVKTTSPGPVLYGQERVAQHDRLITIHKFRSMRVSEASDTEWTAETRVTGIGKWLRRFSLDEIPQMYSVLKGDMSLVGPRPERPFFVESFSHEIQDYEERHRMPVGITGLAQIVGLRGDTSIAERVKYDNLYIDQWSMGVDLRIMAKTVWVVLRQGRYADQAVELERALTESRRRGIALGRPIDLREPSAREIVATAEREAS